MLGKVRMFDERRGFGFVSADDGQDYFCHVSQLVNRQPDDALVIGERLKFEIAESRRKRGTFECINVQRLDGSDNAPDPIDVAQARAERVLGGRL